MELLFALSKCLYSPCDTFCLRVKADEPSCHSSFITPVLYWCNPTHQPIPTGHNHGTPGPALPKPVHKSHTLEKKKV